TAGLLACRPRRTGRPFSGRSDHSWVILAVPGAPGGMKHGFPRGGAVLPADTPRGGAVLFRGTESDRGRGGLGDRGGSSRVRENRSCRFARSACRVWGTWRGPGGRGVGKRISRWSRGNVLYLFPPVMKNEPTEAVSWAAWRFQRRQSPWVHEHSF